MLGIIPKRIAVLSFVSLLVSGCQNTQPQEQDQPDLVKGSFAFATAQTEHMLQLMQQEEPGTFPKSTDREGKLVSVGIYDWTSGFFPGSLWYLYEYTQDSTWKNRAEAWTAKLEPVKDFYGHHDVGFMMGSSYGNGYRLTNDSAYRDIIIQSAKSLSKRYSQKVGAILSWDADKGWQSKRGWKYPVIIDNMINLELLFKATELSGDSSFYKMAVSHADRTLENHFRPDFSSYHVIDYDPETGKARNKHTAQGHSHESAWARGQAWALYGFTFCYRETKDERYLQLAQNIANYLLNHPNLPEDMVPYWDFNAPEIPDAPRDASSASVIASALFELSEYSQGEKAETYVKAAEKMLASLSSKEYRAEVGGNQGFLLMHSVGSIPHNNEINAPLVYADYYYLEALLRYQKLQGQK